MTDEDSQTVAWSDEAWISCEFPPKYPKQWDRIQPTANEGVRHCLECDRGVHRALTEEDFRRRADSGQCVAVRVLRSVRLLDDSKEDVVGNVNRLFNSPLRPL